MRKVKRLEDHEVLALPVTVDVETAGRAFGFGRTKAFQLAKDGKFPCEVLTYGRRLVVTKAAITSALGIRWAPGEREESADAA